MAWRIAPGARPSDPEFFKDWAHLLVKTLGLEEELSTLRKLSYDRIMIVDLGYVNGFIESNLGFQPRIILISLQIHFSSPSQRPDPSPIPRDPLRTDPPRRTDPQLFARSYARAPWVSAAPKLVCCAPNFDSRNFNFQKDSKDTLAPQDVVREFWFCCDYN